jgi:hypothetical protein
MSTLEIKKKLISKIKLTKNQNLLEEIYRLLELEYDDMEILELSEDQKKGILKGKTDIKKGKTITNEQADSEIDKWLKK